MNSRSASLLIAIGTALGASSKWFLVWLFARSSGGAAAVGQYSLILAFATPLFVASQLGLRTIFLSSTTRWPWSAFVKLRVTGIISATVVISLFLSISYPQYLALGLAIVALKSADSALDIQLARLQYAARMAQLGLIMCVSALAAIVFASIAVWTTDRVVPGVLAAALASVMATIWARAASRRLPYAADSTRRNFSGILTASIPVTSSQFLATLLFQIPVLILALTRDTVAIGVFAAAAYLLTAANLAGSTMQTILITPWRQLFATAGPTVLRRTVWRAATKATLIGALVAGPVIIWGNQALRVIYGAEFNLGRLHLALLMIAAIATMVAYLLSVSLNISNRYYSVTWSMAFSCLVAYGVGLLLLNGAVDPLTMGALVAAVGAAARALSLGYLLSRSSRG